MDTFADTVELRGSITLLLNQTVAQLLDAPTDTLRSAVTALAQVF